MKTKGAFKKNLKNAFFTSKYSPGKWIEKEEKRTIYEAKTGENKRYLTHQEALLVSIAAIISATISVYAKFSYILRYAHFHSNEVMMSWNIYIAPIMIVSSCLFMYVMHKKGIYYWLVWFIPIASVVYFTIEFLLLAWILDVNVLAEFFKSIGLYDLPEWIIGQPYR